MPYKNLRRSIQDQIVAGVCGGYAEYFNTDVWLVRIIFIVLTVFGGSGVLLYLISWFMIPSENPSEEHKKFMHDIHNHMRSNSRTGHKIIGLIIVLVGLLLLLDNIFPDLGFEKFWPVLLIIFGGVIMIGHSHYEHPEQK